MSPKRKRQEGAVLFIVLLMIMLGTSSAIFAIHTAAVEVRGTGFARQHVQAQFSTQATLYAALDWIDIFGPETVRQLIEADGTEFVDHYPEVNLADGRKLYRLYPEHFDALVTGGTDGYFEVIPVVDATTYGTTTNMQARNTVDIYDERITNLIVAGQRADGGGSFDYLRSTVTARGIASFPGDITEGAVAYGIGDIQDRREFNSVAKDMRAYVTTGPFQSGQ